MSEHRVSPPRVTAGATRAPRPAAGSEGSTDAHRQTGFLLRAECDLVVQGLELEGAIASASTGAKSRTQLLAASLGLWSRAWLARLAALHAVEWGNYVSAIALIRAAADYQASMLYVLRDGGAEWQAWLNNGGVSLAADVHATEFRLHAFRAAEVLAAHETLGPVYRVATDLSLSHFGSTLLAAGNESGPDRVLMTFGDRDFHFGLAEVCLGWLAALGDAMAGALEEFPAVFTLPDAGALGAWRREAAGIVVETGRCRIEIVERDGEKRYLVHNWTREPRSAPKRLLL